MSRRDVDLEELLTFQMAYRDRCVQVSEYGNQLRGSAKKAEEMLRDSVSKKTIQKIGELAEYLVKLGDTGEELMERQIKHTTRELEAWQALLSGADGGSVGARPEAGGVSGTVPRVQGTSGGNSSSGGGGVPPENTPMQALTAYMVSHNYGVDDYDTYSQDPEWQKLHQAAFPGYYRKIKESEEMRLDQIRTNLGAKGMNTADFSGYVAFEASPGKWFVASDDSHECFMDYWDNMANSYIEPCNEIKTISSRQIEGVEVYESDLEYPDKFWQMHESGGTKESFLEIAKKIPEVQKRLDEGATMEDLIDDERLGKCTNIYFYKNPWGSGQEATVIEYNGFYILQGNGRHRILAAQELDMKIPIRIIGRMKKK